MERFCDTENIKFLSNNHISKSNQFYDHKHLNFRGFKFFAKNLKSAIFGTITRQSKLMNNRSSNPSRHQFSSPLNHRQLSSQSNYPSNQFSSPPPPLWSSDNRAWQQRPKPQAPSRPYINHEHGSHDTRSPTYATITAAGQPNSFLPKPPHLANVQRQNGVTGLPPTSLLKSLMEQLQMFI